MSVLIKGMEMPKGCITCMFKSESLFNRTMWCYWFDNPLGDYSKCDEKWRHPDCPLVEVPPHGHLIDGEVLWDQLRYGHDVDLSELPETLAAFKKAEENPRCGTGEGGEVRPYRA